MHCSSSRAHCRDNFQLVAIRSDSFWIICCICICICCNNCLANVSVNAHYLITDIWCRSVGTSPNCHPQTVKKNNNDKHWATTLAATPCLIWQANIQRQAKQDIGCKMRLTPSCDRTAAHKKQIETHTVSAPKHWHTERQQMPLSCSQSLSPAWQRRPWSNVKK